MNPQEYSLNIRPGAGYAQTVKVSQGDVGRPLRFNLLDGSEALGLQTGTAITIHGTKPSGLGFTETCTWSGSAASVNTTLEMTQENGTFPAELVLTLGNEVIGTANFMMNVERSPHDENTIDGTYDVADSIFARMDTIEEGLDATNAEVEQLAASVPTVDATLTVSGAAADAKKTGDEITQLKSNLTLLDYHVRYETEEVIAVKSVPTTSGTTIGASESGFNVSIASGASFRFRVSGTSLINKFTLYYNDGGSSKRFGTNLLPNTNYDYTAPETVTRLYIYTGGTDVIGSGTLELTVSNVVQNNDSVDKHISDLTEEVSDLTNALGIDPVEGISIDGYSDANLTATIIGNAPFIYGFNEYEYAGALITKIKMNVLTAGTISLGTIKKSNVSQGMPNFDMSNAIVKATATATATGEQELSVSNPFTVESDEYLFIGMRTDTIQWCYGHNGTDTKFWYVDGTVVYRTNSSVGVTIYIKTGMTSKIREVMNSVYKGKTLSILGDSISTFSGYIPSGNATYYPSGTVTKVTDTWWKKLIDALGVELNVNNSWSGSRVTTTGGTASAGCGERAEALGTSPDIIIVWMGINDFNNEVALGTYDGTTALPSVTTTFREAYAIMLNKILTKYQTSEVWVCTLPQCERNAETGFPEINGNGVALAEFNKAIKELADAFGVKVLDHNKCGLTYQNMPTYNPDNLHPNKDGHSLIANNDIRQMDNAVSKRY